MHTKDADNQAKNFALRLREALQQRGKKLSPTALKREFNLRYQGHPVTIHATRKWLLGLTVPTQDKLEVLARWLDVSSDWLRWGKDLNNATTRGQTSADNTSIVSPMLARQNQGIYAAQEESSLIQDWRLLEPRNKQLVRAIIELLLRNQHESQRSKTI